MVTISHDNDGKSYKINNDGSKTEVIKGKNAIGQDIWTPIIKDGIQEKNIKQRTTIDTHSGVITVENKNPQGKLSTKDVITPDPSKQHGTLQQQKHQTIVNNIIPANITRTHYSTTTGSEIEHRKQKGTVDLVTTTKTIKPVVPKFKSNIPKKQWGSSSAQYGEVDLSGKKQYIITDLKPTKQEQTITKKIQTLFNKINEFDKNTKTISSTINTFRLNLSDNIETKLAKLKTENKLIDKSLTEKALWNWNEHIEPKLTNALLRSNRNYSTQQINKIIKERKENYIFIKTLKTKVNAFSLEVMNVGRGYLNVPEAIARNPKHLLTIAGLAVGIHLIGLIPIIGKPVIIGSLVAGKSIQIKRIVNMYTKNNAYLTEKEILKQRSSLWNLELAEDLVAYATTAGFKKAIDTINKKRTKFDQNPKTSINHKEIKYRYIYDLKNLNEEVTFVGTEHEQSIMKYNELIIFPESKKTTKWLKPSKIREFDVKLDPKHPIDEIPITYQSTDTYAKAYYYPKENLYISIKQNGKFIELVKLNTKTQKGTRYLYKNKLFDFKGKSKTDLETLKYHLIRNFKNQPNLIFKNTRLIKTEKVYLKNLKQMKIDLKMINEIPRYYSQLDSARINAKIQQFYQMNNNWKPQKNLIQNKIKPPEFTKFKKQEIEITREKPTIDLNAKESKVESTYTYEERINERIANFFSHGKGTWFKNINPENKITFLNVPKELKVPETKKSKTKLPETKKDINTKLNQDIYNLGENDPYFRQTYEQLNALKQMLDIKTNQYLKGKVQLKASDNKGTTIKVPIITNVNKFEEIPLLFPLIIPKNKNTITFKDLNKHDQIRINALLNSQINTLKNKQKLKEKQLLKILNTQLNTQNLKQKQLQKLNPSLIPLTSIFSNPNTFLSLFNLTYKTEDIPSLKLPEKTKKKRRKKLKKKKRKPFSQIKDPLKTFTGKSKYSKSGNVMLRIKQGSLYG